MPKRWVKEKNKFYPNGQNQLRRAKPRLVIEHICGFLTGHEISMTEWGYGSTSNEKSKCWKQYIDRSCRWCDKSIEIPITENILPQPFKGLMNVLEDDESDKSLFR
jgi:hypothetical protein